MVARPAGVTIIMGSANDKPVAEQVTKVLGQLRIDFRVRVLSAHRNAEELREFLRGDAYANVYIGIAGLSAALPGVIASMKPECVVIGLPVPGDDVSIPVNSMVHMPPGVPIATVGNPKNAALLAAQIIALKDGADPRRVAAALTTFRGEEANAAKAKGETAERELNPVAQVAATMTD